MLKHNTVFGSALSQSLQINVALSKPNSFYQECPDALVWGPPQAIVGTHTPAWFWSLSTPATALPDDHHFLS